MVTSLLHFHPALTSLSVFRNGPSASWSQHPANGTIWMPHTRESDISRLNHAHKDNFLSDKLLCTLSDN